MIHLDLTEREARALAYAAELAELARDIFAEAHITGTDNLAVGHLKLISALERAEIPEPAHAGRAGLSPYPRSPTRSGRERADVADFGHVLDDELDRALGEGRR